MTTLTAVEITPRGSRETGFTEGQRIIAPVAMARQWQEAGWCVVLDDE